MKSDIEVSRQMTINTENFSSIRPSIKVSLKDVDVKDLTEAYEKLSAIADNLFQIEIANLGNTQLQIQRENWKRYSEEIDTQYRYLIDSAKKEIEELNG